MVFRLLVCWFVGSHGPGALGVARRPWPELRGCWFVGSHGPGALGVARRPWPELRGCWLLVLMGKEL